MSRSTEKRITYQKLWALLTELRGKVDGWDFKNYSLTMIFYKFLCEKFEKRINDNQIASGDAEFDYSEITDELAEDAKENIIEDSGFFIKPSELFCNICKRKDDADLNKIIADAFNNLQESVVGTYAEDNLSGVFADFDVTSAKLGSTVKEKCDTLGKLINCVNGINFGSSHSKLVTDTFGDMYEYLMGMYAANAGKSGGEYFTPSEVSELMARLVMIGRKEVKNIYDPACGSGSLLLKAGKVIGPEHVTKGFYGQELNNTTYNLCRENMILHDIDNEKINIKNGDTLKNPQHINEKFEIIVSNPPYSTHWEPDVTTITDERFAPAGVLAPTTKADYAFVEHIIFQLMPNGSAGVVLPHGVLFRGGTEGIIRKHLVDNNYIDAIIGLPSNLFFGTGIPTIIMLLKKERSTNDILFVDASKCFTKDKNQNVLREMDSEKIYNAVKDRKNIKSFAKLVSKDEIINNEYNLNIPRYVAVEDEDIFKDLYSLMSSKISSRDIASFDIYFGENFPELKEAIFETDTTYTNYYNFKDINLNDVVYSDPKVVKFNEDINAYLDEYKKMLIDKFITNLNNYSTDVFEEIKFELNKNFSRKDLIDVYEVYQILADNITEIQADISVLQDKGIEYCRNYEPNISLKKVKKKLEEVQDGYKGSILPFELIQKKYLTAEFDKMEDIKKNIEEQISIRTSALEDLDDDIKKEFCKKNDDGELEEELKIVEKDFNSFFKKLPADDENYASLLIIKNAINEEKKLNKDFKTIQLSLDDKTMEKMAILTDEEIEDCLEEKWINPIIDKTAKNLHSIVDIFIKKLKTLNTKYTGTLSGIQEKIKETDKEILSFLDGLTGSDSDMEAIKLLKDVLK